MHKLDKHFDFYKKFADCLKLPGFTTTHDSNKITITNSHNSAQQCIINFDQKEYEEEIGKVKYYDQYVAGGDNFVNYILFDKDKAIQDTKSLEGAIEGTIRREFDTYYGVICTSINESIDISKIRANWGNTVSLRDLIKDDLVICDIQKISDRSFSEAVVKGDLSSIKQQIHKVLYSILTHLAYTEKILLADLSNEYRLAKPTTTASPSACKLSIINNDELMYYFLLAERVEYSHLKYLEYYHILEFFFLYSSIRKIKNLIKDAHVQLLTNSAEPDDKFYREQLQSFNKLKTEAGEEEQIKEVIREIIGYPIIANQLNQLAIRLNFLSNPFFNRPDTQVTIDPSILEGGKKTENPKFVQHLDTNDKKKNSDIFCDGLARRIYKIRNQIVHTKQGEGTVFTPTYTNLKLLEDDLKVIRAIVFALMIKA